MLGVSRQVSGGSGGTVLVLPSSSILGSTRASLHRSPWLAARETPNLQPDSGDRSSAFIARLFLQTCSIRLLLWQKLELRGCEHSWEG